MDTIREHLRWQWWRFWYRLRIKVRKSRQPLQDTPQHRVTYNLNGEQVTVNRFNATGFTKF